MAILKALPGPHISEFARSSDGHQSNGTCTQASAAMAFAAAHNPSMSQQACIDLMQKMRGEMYARDPNVSDTGCAQNGAATYKSMAYELRQLGASINTEWDYAGDVMPHDWHALLKQYAGVKPIMLQVANAKALVDSAGTHEDGGVRYHSIYIAGIASDGYVVYDPNNPTVMQTGDIYPYDNGQGYGLVPAEPCGLIMLDMPTPPAPQPPPLPAGVTEANGVVTFPGGYTAIEGFAQAYLADPAHIGLALANAVDLGNGASEQLFERAVLTYDPKQGVQNLPPGERLISALARLADIKKLVEA